MKRFTEAGRTGSHLLVVAASALVAVMAGSSGASAQPAPATLPANCSGTITGNVSNISNFGGGPVSSVIAGVVGSVNTAFLTQQGSAFVSAPSNPAPDQPGGGVWARALGGEVDVKSTSSNIGSGAGGGFTASVNSRCDNNLHQVFSGLQVGTDIAKLNLNGWNVHVGTTAGYLGSTASDDPNSVRKVSLEVPFFGAYVVATYGRFFADLMVRREFYNMTFDSPGLNLNGQTIGAHGVSVSTSAGYNFALANNWFIEPSAGFVWSSTKVDSFNAAVPDGNFSTIGATTATNDVSSQIGRLSIRVGTTFTTPKVNYQPFVTASVFHEFAGDVVANSAICPTCAVIGPLNSPFQFSNLTKTTRVGTYGQYSLGLAAQIVDTGWLGFVRADYKHGDMVTGYTGNVGLRYQFTPDAFVSPVRYAKAPVKAVAPVFGTTNWTGFYVGAHAGAAAGRSDIGFANDPAGAGTSPHVFGPIGGIQVGYNHQVNNWVFGVEGDAGVARIFGARTCGTDAGTDGAGNTVRFNPFYQNCNDRMNWTATAAARVGYASGRTLFYVKGGGAWADGRVKVDCIDAISVPCLNPQGNQYPTFNANFTEYTTANYNRFGWLIGYGTEFDLGKNWSAKAEYDYIQFGRQTQLASDAQTLLLSRTSISQVKIGLNYRLGGESAEVVSAAPMYTKAARAPVVASIYDWTGFYVGGNVGGAVSTKNWEFFDGVGFVGEGTHAASGPIFGAHAGYRWQSGRAVFGVEAQGNVANMHGANDSFLLFNGGQAFQAQGDTNQTRIRNLGIFTGQVGYTAFDTLLYVKGGAVVVAESYDVLDFATNALKAQFNDTRWGAAIGAGVEYAFTQNLTAGIDYVHGFMGTKTVDIPDLINGGIYETERIRQRLDLVTLRASYKFSPTSVVAKY